MVPPGRVTSTLTSLLIAVAPSYAALPMHCVYVCGNCNLTPLALCNATGAGGPGLPPRPTPCGASGAQSFDTCDRALGLDEQSAKAWYRRGQACLKLGQHEAARKNLTRACQLAPGSREIREELEKCKRPAAGAKFL